MKPQSAYFDGIHTHVLWFALVAIFALAVFFVVKMIPHLRNEQVDTYLPIIDRQGVDSEQYHRDVRECNSYIHEAAKFGDRTYRGVLSRRHHAAVVKKCIIGRGYKVLE